MNLNQYILKIDSNGAEIVFYKFSLQARACEGCLLCSKKANVFLDIFLLLELAILYLDLNFLFQVSSIFNYIQKIINLKTCCVIFTDKQ